jgi:hypothetical protein
VDITTDAAIVPLVPLVNRRYKRQFEKDAIRVIMPLEEVNTTFLYHLFDESNKATYAGLYNYYHDLWMRTVEELVKSRNFPTIGIDKLWFARQYSPEYGNA